MLTEWTSQVEAWFTTRSFPMRDWMDTLITIKEPEILPLTVAPSPHIQFAAIFMAHARLYNLSYCHDDMRQAGRFVTHENANTSSPFNRPTPAATAAPAAAAASATAPAAATASSSSSATSGRARGRANQQFNLQELIRCSMIPFQQDGSHSITDDAACMYVDEFQHVQTMVDLQEQKRLYCLMCETNTQSYIGIGTCSAKSFTTKSEEKAIFCFNCGATVFIFECGDQYGFHPLEDELIMPTHSRINFNNGADDINLDEYKRVVFLDAPMGTGKNHLAKQYINMLDPATTVVLSITFRISLAKYLTSEFGFTSYTEDSVRTDQDSMRRERIVVCLDSIVKLKKDEEYQVVIIDEATFVQYHLVAGTIPTTDLNTIIQKLKTILQHDDKVIFMQHRIPGSTINFYCNITNVDPFDRHVVTKRKFNAPTVLQPSKRWAKITDMVSYMIKDYIDSFNTDDQKSISPFIVFCSRVDFSMALLQIFRSVAEARFGVGAVERVKGVWAQVQNDAWCSRFITNPNSAALDCDIMIVTNVLLQAGHSLDTHFKSSSYDILFNNLLSFREELQFISCLRYLGRTDDMRAVKNAWIEAGKSNQHIANATKLQQSLSSLVSTYQHVDFNLILSTISSVNSERADTSNRHMFLWSEEYRRSEVAVQTAMDELTLDNNFTYTSTWVAN